MDTARIRVFKIDRRENYAEPLDVVSGWGVEMPDGTCFVGWNQDAFPEEHRFREPHYSQYGCIEDVRQSSCADVTMLHSEKVVTE